MEILVIIITGVLFGCGVYAMLSRSLFRALLGMMLLGHAANLAVFSAGGLTVGAPAILVDGTVPSERVADPLPQALVLTAIVIGLGLASFAIALFAQAARAGVAPAQNLSRFEEKEAES